tara:strand:- start:2048 stop:3616 length:1569 start_codon:yes stop_codon:yes gene_type:complete
MRLAEIATSVPGTSSTIERLRSQGASDQQIILHLESIGDIPKGSVELPPSSYDTKRNELISGLQDYEANQKKYSDRLRSLSAPSSNFNIFDLATSLSQGMSAQMQTDRPNSLAGGFALGFNKASERMKANKEIDRKANQQVALEAARLAMTDEQSALKMIQDYDLKKLEYANARGDLLALEYKDAEGNIVQKTVRDNASNDHIIDELIEVYGANEVTTPGTRIDLGGTDKRADKAIERQYKTEDEINAKAKAGNASLFNVEYAQELAEKLGPANFGEIAKLSFYPRKLIAAIKKENNSTAEQIIGDQILLSQISMGFTMDIVSRTKGAISNREMELFIQASPGLGSNYDGFMKQSNFLKRIALRDVAFRDAYINESDRLEELEDRGELKPQQVYRKLTQFETDWYERSYYDPESDSFITGDSIRNNLVFTKEETDLLKSIQNGTNPDYKIAEGFNSVEFAKGWRQGQQNVSEEKSTYTQNKSIVDETVVELREKIKNSDGTDEEKEELLNLLDAQLKGTSDG